MKFTPSGGTVSVRARLSDAGQLVIDVTDTGIGIAADDIDWILIPFNQADGTLSRRFEGTGLGLPLSKSLIEQHQGTLEIESEPERGTRVRVTLPAARLIMEPDS